MNATLLLKTPPVPHGPPLAPMGHRNGKSVPDPVSRCLVPGSWITATGSLIPKHGTRAHVGRVLATRTFRLFGIVCPSHPCNMNRMCSVALGAVRVYFYDLPSVCSGAYTSMCVLLSHTPWAMGAGSTRRSPRRTSDRGITGS